jgi:hypothetical protein
MNNQDSHCCRGTDGEQVPNHTTGVHQYVSQRWFFCLFLLLNSCRTSFCGAW